MVSQRTPFGIARFGGGRPEDPPKFYRRPEPASRPPVPSLAQLRSDEFLAVMAHELRNPLAPVSNAVEVLTLAGLADPRLQRVSDIIGRQVKHIARMVDDLMDASCLSHGKLTLRKTRCDLAAIVRDTAADYRATL